MQVSELVESVKMTIQADKEATVKKYLRDLMLDAERCARDNERAQKCLNDFLLLDINAAFEMGRRGL